VEIAANPRKTLSFRELGAVDVASLKAVVLAIPEDVWTVQNESKPNQFGALRHASHLIFRFVSQFKDWRDSYDSPLWPEWRGLLEPVLRQATRPYGYAQGAFPRVMLARMPAGTVIYPHRDANPAAKWPHKIHVPLQTDERVVFFVDGVGRHLAEGVAVEVNNMGVHAVKNESDQDRIHLIFEYYDTEQPEPEWLAPLLAGEQIGA